MPELPEVEVIRRGIIKHIVQRKVTDIIVRQPKFINAQSLSNQNILAVNRRGKYLLLETSSGATIISLGMSGTLRIVSISAPVSKHDHVDFVFKQACILRFNDPRRFGNIFWTPKPIQEHPRLKNLGPEPLSDNFNGNYLYQFALTRTRSKSIKELLMDGTAVTGIGNIYATETLFKAGVAPQRQARDVSPKQYQKLSHNIKQVLADAIAQGGTTLKDFVSSDGKPGYFKQQLNVYGRSGLPCFVCKQPLAMLRQAGRATVFCKQCQT